MRFRVHLILVPVNSVTWMLAIYNVELSPNSKEFMTTDIWTPKQIRQQILKCSADKHDQGHDKQGQKCQGVKDMGRVREERHGQKCQGGADTLWKSPNRG